MIAPAFNLFCGEDGSDQYQRVLKKCSSQVTLASTALLAARQQLPTDSLTTTTAKEISELVVYPMAQKKSGPNNRMIV